MPSLISSTLLVSLILLIIINHGVFAYKMAIHHNKHPKLKHLFNVNKDNIHNPKLKHLFNDNKDNIHGKFMVEVFDEVYVVGIEIGSQQVYLVFDTGSHFTWVQWKDCSQCLPDNIYPITTQYQKSPNFSYEYCNATNIGNGCNNSAAIPDSDCEIDLCSYSMSYVDGSSSYGYVANEVFTPFTDKTISQKMVFGLGVENECHPTNDSCFQGIAGFGVGPFAFPSQLTPTPDRWAFCLPLNASMDGAFMVGDEAHILGEYYAAPLFQGDYHYLANITRILVVGLETMAVTVSNDTSTVLIDTGTTLSYLLKDVFENLKALVEDTVLDFYDVKPELSDYSNLELCYTKAYQIEISILLGEAYFYISDPQRIWLALNDSYYCLSFLREDGSEYNVLGTQHVSGHKIAYYLTPENPTLQVSSGRNDDTGCFT